MAQETKLIKEFSKRDIQRARNIITGNTGDRTQVQSGYEKKSETHKEGDVWEEQGKTWTVKNGIKQTVTKMDSIKKMFFMPLSCPKCKKPMKSHDINKKMYQIHSMCLDCVVEMEAEIKRLGKWEEYQSNIMNSNKNAAVDDFEKAVESWFHEKGESFVSENGEVEDWAGGDKTKMYEEIKTFIDNLKAIKI